VYKAGTKIDLHAVDVYCWSASFCSLILDTECDLKNNKYKHEEDYKQLIKKIKAKLDSLNLNNPMLIILKKVILNALKCNPEERSKISEIFNYMKNYKLNYYKCNIMTKRIKLAVIT